MKDCILAIFWPKKEIYAFLKDCSVPINVLNLVDKWDEKNLSRADMVNEALDALSNQSDNGTLHFNLMLNEPLSRRNFPHSWVHSS